MLPTGFDFPQKLHVYTRVLNSVHPCYRIGGVFGVNFHARNGLFLCVRDAGHLFSSVNRVARCRCLDASTLPEYS
jgi:hypothetical protein